MNAQNISDVAEVEAQWNALYMAGAVEPFAALLHGSFLYMSERGTFDKSQYVQNLAAGVIKIRRLETESSTVRQFNDVFIVNGTVLLEASFQGQDISGRDLYTRIWLKSSSGLQAVTQHASQATR